MDTSKNTDSNDNSAEKIRLLIKNSPICERCRSAQVQMHGGLSLPQGWKCRLCKHVFKTK